MSTESYFPGGKCIVQINSVNTYYLNLLISFVLSSH